LRLVGTTRISGTKWWRDEFHSTGGNVLTNNTRSATTTVKSGGRPYKAIVVVFQNGGCDSYNLIAPLSGCSSSSAVNFAQFQQVRGDAGLNATDLLPISVPSGSQPCSQFGVHNTMPNLKSLYDNKEALFVANVGALIEPISKADFLGTSGVVKQFPPSLFAHNVMQLSMHNLDPDNLAAKGVLGRTVTALLDQANYKSDLYSLIGVIKMLEGDQEPDYIDPYSGVQRFNQFNAFNATFGNMTEFEAESFSLKLMLVFLLPLLRKLKLLVLN